MKLMKRLGNPVALVAQGFLVGAALFLATHPGTGSDIAGMAFASAPASTPLSHAL